MGHVRAEVAPHHGQLAATVQACLQGLACDFTFGEPRLPRFFLQGLGQFLSKADRQRLSHETDRNTALASRQDIRHRSRRTPF